jgi:hypothetical protein
LRRDQNDLRYQRHQSARPHDVMRLAPMSPENLKQTKRFCSPQDQIQWGILFLSRHLRGLSAWEREECLQDEWEWARQRGDLLCLQVVRDYRECRTESGPTYRCH